MSWVTDVRLRIRGGPAVDARATSGLHLGGRWTNGR